MADSVTPQPPEADSVPTSVTIRTLFGDKEFLWDKAIYFPTGIKGFPDHNVFALANFPGESNNTFILMQSLTEPELAFIVAPYNMESNSIKPEHLAQAFTIHGIKKDEGAVLLIVTLHKPDDGGETSMSVNLRAPIIIDTSRQAAYQHLLPDTSYSYHQTLGA